MKATIITIGDEILIGQIVDTNSAWLGQKLNERGVQVEKIISVKDNENEIHKALDEAFALGQLIIMTGGLGPTLDDITKKTLCSYFNTHLVFSDESFGYIKEYLDSKGASVNENNRNQAMLPGNCTPIRNYLGTAPIMEFEHNGVVLYSLPGVPYEMKYAMEHEVFPRMQHRFNMPPVFHQTIMTFGIAEAFLAERLSNWEKRLPEHIKLAYLPSPKTIRLRLSVYQTDKIGWETDVKKAIDDLQKEIPDNIFSLEGKDLTDVLSNLLRSHSLSLSTAESCTGGTIAQKITALPGASDIFKGSIVSYSNEIKQRILGVKEETLIQHGAVSKACVMEMAENVKKQFQTNCAIAVSGIAGPSGGTPEKPVGMVWIAVSTDNNTFAEKFSLGNNRDVNIEKASYTALFMLFSELKKELVTVDC